MATFSLDGAISGINSLSATLNGANPITQQQVASFESNGFLLSASPESDGTGLAFAHVQPGANAKLNRNIITWFVPQFGIVKMFINPQNITYNHRKLISRDRTKGGYTLQYWGEELSTLNISGTTGSAGIEGINMLYEIYRAEQYAFDAVGLTLAGNNASADLANNLIQGIGGALGQAITGSSSVAAQAGGAGLLGGILGMNSPNNNLSVRNIPSLASLAFAVEMYYNGWVYRGFFENMTITERADNFLLDYQMTFVVTQRRGYRTNYFPWSNNPRFAPSGVGLTYPNGASSFTGETTINTNIGVQNINQSSSPLGFLSSLL